MITSAQSGNDKSTDIASVPSMTSSSAWLPTALVTAATTVAINSDPQASTDSTSTAQATGAPSTPKIITPTDGIPDTPANSTLVTIGFLESLNYAFVVENSVTVAQIFHVLPLASSFALEVPGGDITVRSLQPYAVSQYTATTALLWVPSDQVQSLQVQILASNSRLYSQSDPTAQQLVNQIDSTIPIITTGAASNTGGSAGGYPNSDGNVGLSNSGAIGGS